MCGLNGVLGPDANTSASSLKTAMSSLNHRGPDGGSIFRTKDVLFGHCRLAIAGGKANAQPATSKSGNTTVVFNGQIYNASTLAKRFDLPLSPEEVFADALVLVELLDILGSTALQHLDGVFAGMWYDKRNLMAYLFMDEFGTRPLYYTNLGRNIYFSSEIHSLAELAKMKLEINPQALMQYFAFFTPIGQQSWFKGIQLVEPGQVLAFSLKNFHLSMNSFTPIEYRDKVNSVNDFEETLEVIFSESLLSQIPFDEDFSFLLSSGVDSSLIASFLHSIPHAKSGVSIFYPENQTSRFDESKEVLEFATKMGFPISMVGVTAELFNAEHLNTLRALEEPRVGQSVINFLAFERSRIFGKVTFSGAGADELFGGYPWRYPLSLENNAVVPQTLTPQGLEASILRSWSRVIPFGEWKHALSPTFAAQTAEEAHNVIADFSSKRDSDLDGWGSTKIIMDFERRSFLRALLLVDDRLSMHHSLEVRVPFLSREMAKFSRLIPISNLFGIDEDQGGIIGKFPLRKLLASKSPNGPAFRPKKGFSAPDSDWFRVPSKSIFDSLFHESQPIWDIINRTYGERIWKLHLAGEDRRASLWGMLSLNELLRRI